MPASQMLPFWRVEPTYSLRPRAWEAYEHGCTSGSTSCWFWANYLTCLSLLLHLENGDNNNTNFKSCGEDQVRSYAYENTCTWQCLYQSVQARLCCNNKYPPKVSSLTQQKFIFYSYKVCCWSRPLPKAAFPHMWHMIQQIKLWFHHFNKKPSGLLEQRKRLTKEQGRTLWFPF